jgi:hypothetical protein
MTVDPLILPPLIGGALAVLFAWISMRAARKRRYIRDTPTSKAAGVFIGDVELKGTAESAEPLTSHLAEIRCVHYAWLVEEHWRRTRVESYTDSKGNRRTRTVVETGWDTVASGGEQTPFYLRDDSGHILVRPDGMEVEGTGVFSFTCTPGHPLYYGKGPAGSVMGSTDDRCFTERAIPIHANIFVMGAARERRDVVAAEIAHGSEARFSLVTMASEDSVASGYTSRIWVYGIIGAIFACAAMVMPAAIAGARDTGLVIPGVAALAAYLAALACIWALMTFNTLRAQRERVRRGWANIDVELKRRADLIPNIAECVKGARAHERDTHELLARMRAQYAVSPQAVRQGEAAVEGLALSVAAIAERYPDLKTNDNFLALQHELSRTESRIALARTYYNGLVTAFNARIAVFPDSVLAAVGGLRRFAFFEAKGLEREVVKVDFAR